MGQIVLQLLLLVIQAVIIRLAEIIVEKMPLMPGRKKVKKVVAACRSRVEAMRRDR